MVTQFLWVPVEMCHFALENGFYKPLKLYLGLQYSCSGKTPFNGKFRNELAELLGVSTKTVTRQMDPLLDRNWIGHNRKSGIYFIRGFNRISSEEGFISRTGAFHTTKDLTTTRAFCSGAIICHNILRRQRAAKKRSSTAKPDGPTQRPDILSASYLQQMIGMSKTTCRRYRSEAQKHGYLNMQPFAEKQNGWDMASLKLWRYLHPDQSGRYFYESGQIYERMGHRIIPKMLFKTRRQN